jgi:hypothetical protein
MSNETERPRILEQMLAETDAEAARDTETRDTVNEVEGPSQIRTEKGTTWPDEPKHN